MAKSTPGYPTGAPSSLRLRLSLLGLWNSRRMLADMICQPTRFAHDAGELQVRWRICMTKLCLLWVTGPGKIPAGGQGPSVR
jgi:hypothetical protein